jgi:predicted aconitase
MNPQNVTVPIYNGEPDSPERLIRDLEATLVQARASSKRNLEEFINAIDGVSENLKAAVEQLDTVSVELEAIKTGSPISEQDEYVNLLQEVEREEDEMEGESVK